MSEPLTDAQIVQIIVHGAMVDGIAPEQASALARELFALRAENAQLRQELRRLSNDLSFRDELPFVEEGDDEQTS